MDINSYLLHIQNMQEYLKEFDIPEYIDIWKYSDGNIQNLFQNALVFNY